MKENSFLFKKEKDETLKQLYRAERRVEFRPEAADSPVPPHACGHRSQGPRQLGPSCCLPECHLLCLRSAAGVCPWPACPARTPAKKGRPRKQQEGEREEPGFSGRCSLLAEKFIEINNTGVVCEPQTFRSLSKKKIKSWICKLWGPGRAGWLEIQQLVKSCPVTQTERKCGESLI